MSDQIARPTTSTNPKIDPQDVAHHLRVAAEKYHELAGTLLEQMNEAVAAVPDYRKNSIREGRESLAKLFDDQASDALRLADLFEDTDAVELVAALESIASGNARKVREDRIAAGKVSRPAEPTKFSRDAGHNQLATDLAVAHRTCCVCLETIPDGHGVACPAGSDLEGCWWCDHHGASVPTSDHAACENTGSLQHAPTTWIGNELVNRPVGGAQ